MATVEALAKPSAQNPDSTAKVHSHNISFARETRGNGPLVKRELFGSNRSINQAIRFPISENKSIDVKARQDATGNAAVSWRDLTTNYQTPGVERDGEDYYFFIGTATPEVSQSISYNLPDGKVATVIVSLVPEPQPKQKDSNTPSELAA